MTLNKTGELTLEINNCKSKSTKGVFTNKGLRFTASADIHLHQNNKIYYSFNFKGISLAGDYITGITTVQEYTHERKPIQKINFIFTAENIALQDSSLKYLPFFKK
ncbi:MAG: hypothetical protein GY868_16240 [Deltaproteobacteria bacterium]|nr:hypothetical protein [Deltaproteobacteria bacterium]